MKDSRERVVRSIEASFANPQDDLHPDVLAFERMRDNTGVDAPSTDRVAQLARGFESLPESQIKRLDLEDLAKMSKDIATVTRTGLLASLEGPTPEAQQTVLPAPASPAIEVTDESRLLFLHSSFLLLTLADEKKRRHAGGHLDWRQQTQHWRPWLEVLERQNQSPLAMITKNASGRDQESLLSEEYCDTQYFPCAAYQAVVDDLVAMLSVIRSLIHYSYCDLGATARKSMEPLHSRMEPLKESFNQIMAQPVSRSALEKVPLIDEGLAKELGAKLGPVSQRETRRPYLGLLGPRTPGHTLYGSLTAHGTYIHRKYSTHFLPLWGFNSDPTPTLASPRPTLSPLPTAFLWIEILKTAQAFAQAGTECEWLSGAAIDEETYNMIMPRLRVVQPNLPEQFSSLDEGAFLVALNEAITSESSRQPKLKANQ